LSTSKFKGDNLNWLLKAIFLEEYLYGCGELRQERRDNGLSRVVYTLKNEDVTKDGITYASLYRLYLGHLDPTEYDFANTHLGGWDHWQRLLECDWFQPYVERWRTELELKLKAKAFKEIREEAEAGTKNSFSANKWLIANGWAPNRRGRPSKSEIKAQAVQIAQGDHRVAEDLKRLEIN
jgi:hypothetical protein